MTARTRSLAKLSRISPQPNIRFRRYVIGDDDLSVAVGPKETRRARGGDGPVQDPAHDRALPRTVAVEPQLPCGQAFFHPDGHRAARDHRDLAADGDAVDRPRLGC